MMANADKVVALIDVGSNTIRMVVYCVDQVTREFKSVIDAKDAVGLSSYISEVGAMSEEGITAGCRSVARLVRMSQLAKCDDVCIFATAAVRGCSNSNQVVDALSRSANCPVRVLSGEEEARLSMMGALSSESMRSGLFFDIGGGSTELAGLEKSCVSAYDSIPLGSLSSWKDRVLGDFPSTVELEAIERSFGEMLRISPVEVSKYSELCAIGGTMRLALKVIQRIDKERKSEKSNVMTRADFDRIFDLAEADPSTLAWHVLSIKPERVSTFLPGCAIARSILRASGCSSVRIAKTGLREGYLLSEFCTQAG